MIEASNGGASAGASHNFGKQEALEECSDFTSLQYQWNCDQISVKSIESQPKMQWQMNNGTKDNTIQNQVVSLEVKPKHQDSFDLNHMAEFQAPELMCNCRFPNRSIQL